MPFRFFDAGIESFKLYFLYINDIIHSIQIRMQKLSNNLETQPIMRSFKCYEVNVYLNFYQMEYQICFILTFQVKEKETHQEENIKHFA